MRLFVMTACAATLAIPSAVSAQAVEPDTHVQWLKRPTIETLMGVWPTAALKSGKGGYALISCTVNVLGRPVDCSVVEETPASAGFGAAALAMTPQLLFKPATKDGKPVPESGVRIPVRFPSMDAPTGSRIPGPDPNASIPVRVVSVPQWELAPTVADVAAAYPAKAAAAKLGGSVALQCSLTRTGGLTQCATLREEPFNQGFGSAAKRLARKFVSPSVDATGKSLAGAMVQLPVTFAPNVLEGSPFVTRPKWVSMPTAGDLDGILPEAAAKAGKVKARVVLACTVAQGGVLEACAVETEEPAGVGYGEATLRLARAFRLTTWSPDGVPTVGARIRAPISYDFSDTVAAAR
jgi:TonB family protein